MVKCNFSCIKTGVEDEDGNPIPLCLFKLHHYNWLTAKEYGYWKCDEDDCIFQRILERRRKNNVE